MKTAILAIIIILFMVFQVIHLLLMINLTGMLASICERMGAGKENDEHTQN